MPCLLAKSTLPALLLTSTLAVAAPSAQTIDVVVHASAVTKALKVQLFKDSGRHYLYKPGRCNDPYLENPTVSFRQGRVFIGAHFDGHIGALVGGKCQSLTEPSAVMLSARPVVRSHEAVLEDVRLEGADKPLVAAALQNLIGADLLSPLRINLLDAVGKLTAPDKTVPYSINVRTLELSNLTVQNDELHVTVSGAVEIR